MAEGSAQGDYQVWICDRSGGGDVYGQLVTSGGALVGESFTIAGEAGYVEQAPAVAYDPQDGIYLVVWAQQLSLAQEEYWDIYGRRVGGDGTLLGSALALCTASGDQTAPAVAYSAATGSFLVAWQDARGDGQDIYARAVKGDSGDLGDEFLVYRGEKYAYAPAVAADGAEGEYLVVWQEGEGGDIYGQRTVTDGVAGDPIAITTAAKDQQQPAVAVGAQPAAPCLVVWQHDNGSDWDVRGRVVGADGVLVGSEITITAGAADEQYPAVAANGAGGYVVAWQEGSSNSDVAAAVVDWDGSVLGAGAELLSAAGNSQERPALSYDADRGRYLAVWADYRNEAEGPDVYGQLCRDYTLVVEYRYDPLSRLVGAEYSTGVEFGYAFDAVGNRVRMTETTPLSGTIVTTYDFDAASRLSGRQVSDGRSYSYEWSDRNELLAENTQGVDVHIFAWDAAGRLVQATGFTLTTHFTYAGDGTRVALEVAGHGTTAYVPDHASGRGLLVEATATTSTLYLYGRGCLGEVRDGELLYYLSDGPGYVRQAADEDGTVVDAWLYTPDGGVMAGPQGPVSHLVCGGVYDWSTGLLYKGGRYFDPTLGIWLALGVGVVVQGWRERRRKGRRGVLWCVFLVLVIVGIGGMLAACGPGPGASPLVCIDTDEPVLLSLQADTGGEIGISFFDEALRLHYGRRSVTANPYHSSPRPGVIFTAQSYVPSGVSGELYFKQNMLTLRTIWLDDGSIYQQGGSDWYYDNDPRGAPGDYYTYGRPVDYAWGETIAMVTEDSPNRALNALELPGATGSPIALEIVDRFEMFLVWESHSCPRKALGKVEWSWRARADLVGGEWIPRGEHSPPATWSIGSGEPELRVPADNAYYLPWVRRQ